MAQLSDFFPYVLPYVPGCSDPLMEQHVRDICADFCTATGVIQVALDPISAVAGQDTYDLESPDSNMVVYQILRAWYEDRELQPFQKDSGWNRPQLLNMGFSTAGEHTGTPRAFTQRDLSAIQLDVKPNASSASALTVLAALKPIRTATAVPDLLFTEYAYEIGQGAASRIAQVSSKEFYNPQIARDCAVNYSIARANARIRANKAFARAPVRIIFPGF